MAARLRRCRREVRVRVLVARESVWAEGRVRSVGRVRALRV